MKKFAVGDRFMFVAEVQATNTWGYSLALMSPDGKRVVGPGIIVPEPFLEGAPKVDRPIETGCTVALKDGFVVDREGKVEWTDGTYALVRWKSFEDATVKLSTSLRIEMVAMLKAVKP